MAEYRQSGHALCDSKYHLVGITKYRYKILRGEVAERARDLIRQICHAREVVILRGSVSPDHIHMLVSAPAHLAPSKLVQYVKGGRPVSYKKIFRVCASAIGASICGHAGTFARPWARWMRKRSKPILKTRNGTKTIRVSKSPRPPSLKAGSEPGALQTALAVSLDFQSPSNLPPLGGSGLV